MLGVQITHSRKKLLQPTLTKLALSFTLALGIPVNAQWVAFNDHSPDQSGTRTSPNATTLNCLTAGSVTMRNIADGTDLPVTMSVAIAGTVTGFSTASVPNAGTPLANTFDGYVYFGTSSAAPQSCIQVAYGNAVSITFSGLNPAKRYSFKGGAVRGNSSYANRWGMVNIEGAEGATPAHTAGILTTTTVTDGSLTGYQVACQFGINLVGDMIDWEDINPGSDGSFTITCTQYAGTVPGGSATGASYGYAISGVRLEEIDPGRPLAVTVTPGTNQTVVRCATLTLRANATGGLSPYFYQWSRNGGLIEGATVSSLVINNVQETDAGAYSVVVTDAVPGSPAVAISEPEINVTVAQDLSVPVILSAVSGPDLNTITLGFSKPVLISSTAGVDFVIRLVWAPPTLAITSATLVNGTNVVITTAQELGGQKYQVIIQGSGVTDACNGSAVTGSIAILDRFIVVGLNMNNLWRYDTNGLDLGTSWKDVFYPDEANWPEAAAVFDGMRNPRITVGGQTVGTQLPLNNPNGAYATNNLPTYYFRRHIRFPADVDPREVLVTLRAMFDDAMVVYVNGLQAYQSPIITNGINDVFAAYTGAAIGEASLTAPVSLDPSLFVYGDNVIAVLIKQASATSSDTTMGLEITATITNYSGGCPLIVEATPASVSVAQCGSFTLTGTTIAGSRPHTYRWYKDTTALTDGGNISGATTLNLTVNNAQPASAGNYFLRVTDAASATVDSALIPVTVVAESAPTLVSAVGQPDLHTLVVTFNKPVNISSATGDNFHVLRTYGGLSLTVTNSVANGDTVTLQTAQPCEPCNYHVVVGAGVTGTCSGLAVPTGSIIKIVSQMLIFGLNVNNEWQYNQAGVNLGTDWLNNSYDDHGAGWQTGHALFAGDRDGVPATINGEPVNTQLALTNSIFPTTVAVLPTYYFRKHFTPPTALANMTLACRTFFDDHGIIYINGQEVWRSTNVVATNELFETYLRLNTVGSANYSEVIPLSKDNVVQGDNVIAVYLKQATPGNSDIAMGFELIAIVDCVSIPPPPRLAISKNGNNVTISWGPVTGTLQECTTLGAWGPSSVPNGGTVPISGNKFYRLAP